MKTLKDYVNESVFESAGEVTQKNIFGTPAEIRMMGGGTVRIECLDNSRKVRFEFENQKDFDEIYNEFGANKWIVDCGKVGKTNWAALNFKQNNVWDFHGLTIELPGYGRTGLWGETISNLNLDVKSDNHIDGEVSIGGNASGKLFLNNCNIRGGRVWLHATNECHLKNTTITCTEKSNKETGCFLEITGGPIEKTFNKIYKEILEGKPIKDPLKRLGIEGVNATTITVVCSGGRYADKHITIGETGRHKSIRRNVKSNIVNSEDGKYVLYVSMS